MSADVKPGDVLAVRTDNTAGWWIRIGAALSNKPNLSNHIVVVHHTDDHGTVWGIEGRPGGVGWVDCAQYLKSAFLITNADQLKTDAQRTGVCRTMLTLIGTGYDWTAIVVDGAEDLGFKVPGWNPDFGGTVPGHVVCSSVAAYAYAKNGLTCPSGGREVQPSDWDDFILNRKWLA